MPCACRVPGGHAMCLPSAWRPFRVPGDPVGRGEGCGRREAACCVHLGQQWSCWSQKTQCVPEAAALTWTITGSIHDGPSTWAPIFCTTFSRKQPQGCVVEGRGEGEKERDSDSKELAPGTVEALQIGAGSSGQRLETQGPGTCRRPGRLSRFPLARGGRPLYQAGL